MSSHTPIYITLFQCITLCQLPIIYVLSLTVDFLFFKDKIIIFALYWANQCVNSAKDLAHVGQSALWGPQSSLRELYRRNVMRDIHEYEYIYVHLYIHIYVYMYKCVAQLLAEIL